MRIKSSDLHKVIPKLGFPIDSSNIPEALKPILDNLFNSLPQLADAIALIDELASHVCQGDYRREVVLQDPVLVSFRIKANRILNDDPLAILTRLPPPPVAGNQKKLFKRRF